MNQAGELKQKCEKTIEALKRDLARLRTGRASTGLLEGVTVEYYGAQTPLVQMGMISAPEPKLITVQVYDASAVEAVEKAIRQADLGLNPARDGNLIRINIPALTEDRRKDLIRKLSKMGEESKISIRNHRRDSIDSLKQEQKAGDISEDELRKNQDEVQKVTDRFTGEIDELLAVKEKELMEV